MAFPLGKGQMSGRNPAAKGASLYTPNGVNRHPYKLM